MITELQNKTWQRKELRDLLELVIDHRGKTPKKLGSDWSSSGIPTLSAKNIKDGAIVNKRDIKFIDRELYEKWMPVKLEADDILLTSEAPLGELFYLKEQKDYCLSQRLFALRSNKSRLCPKFLYYYLLSPRGKHELMRRISGTAAEGIRQAELVCINVYYPKSLSEQKRIASILSAFDDKIELNNKINETLEKIAQAIFKEWFIEKSKFKSQNVKLSELVETQYGYTESASEKEIGPKFLRVTDINKTDWVDWNTVPYCKIGDAKFSKYGLKKGDIVIARMADPGKVTIIEENVKAVFASYLIRLKIVSGNITPYFLFYYLRSPLYQDFIFGASTGTTRRSANARVITDVELAIPPKEKILEFERIASMMRNKILVNVKENQELSSLRDLLLPKLVNGEVRVDL